MKEFLLSVLASVVAAVIFLAVPQLTGWFTRKDVCLDVEVQSDSYDGLTIARVFARNSSSFGFDPLKVNIAPYTNLLRLATRQSDGARVHDHTNTNRLEITATLPAGDMLEVLLVADGPISIGEPSRMFSGQFTLIGDRGMPEKRSIRIRSTGEAQLALYLLLAKATGTLVLFVAVLTIGLLMRKRWSKKGSNQ